MISWTRTSILSVMVCLSVATPAFAKDDRVSFAKDITVDEETAAGDLVCMICDIKIHGDVHGDVVTLLGSVIVDGGHSISGDVATVGGDVSIGEGANVGGDLAVVGGSLSRGSGASVRGDSKVMSGRGWLFVPLAPLLILIGFVWLLVWLVNRRRSYLPIYPQRRRY